MEHWHPALPGASNSAHHHGHLSSPTSGVDIGLSDSLPPPLALLGVQGLVVADEDDKSSFSTTARHLYNSDPVFGLPLRKAPRQQRAVSIGGSRRKSAPVAANTRKGQRTHRHELDSMSSKGSLGLDSSFGWKELSHLEECWEELQSSQTPTNPDEFGEKFWALELVSNEKLLPPENGKRARALKTTARYRCNFENCDMSFNTNFALEVHYASMHSESTSARGNLRKSGVAPLEAAGEKLTGTDSTLASPEIHTDNHLPVQLFGMADRCTSHVEGFVSAKRIYPSLAGSSETTDATNPCIRLDPPMFSTSLAELVSADLKPPHYKTMPSTIAQAVLSYDTQVHDQPSAKSWIPLDAQYDAASIPPVSSLGGISHTTEHRRSPKDEIDLALNSTGASTVYQPVREDGPSQQGNAPPSSATCDISELENYKVVCGTGTNYLLSDISNDHGAPQFGRSDDPPASVPLRVTNNLTADHTSDMQIQVAYPPNLEGENARTDPGNDEDNDKIFAIAVTGRIVNNLPITSWSYNMLVGKIHGSLVSKARLGRPDPFNSAKPGKQRLNAYPSNPSFNVQYPIGQLPPKSTDRRSRVVAAVGTHLAVFQAASEDRGPRPPRLLPGLFITHPSVARSRQQKFRKILILALLRYHSLSWESIGLGSSFIFGSNHPSGSDQAPGSTDWLLAGEKCIQSGQGPGSRLCSRQQLEETLSSRNIPDIGGPRLNAFVSKPTHDLTTGSIPQQFDLAPPLPIPLEALSQTYFAGFSEGIAYVYETLPHFRNNTNQPQISQKSSTQDGATMCSDLGLLTAIGRCKTPPLAGLDGRTQTAYIVPVDSGLLPSTNTGSSDGLSRNLATGSVFESEYQVPTPGADPNTSSHLSGPSITPNPDFRPSNYSGRLPIQGNNSAIHGLEISFLPASQTRSQSSQQPSTSSDSASISGISPARGLAGTSKHRCDNCGKSFRRPHLLDDHKRIHTGEETSIYRCKFKGCTRVYKSHSNLTRHFKSHFQDKTQSQLLKRADQVSGEISAQPGAERSERDLCAPSTYHSDRGAPGLDDVRFRPYETPDTIRRKLVPREKWRFISTACSD